MVSGLWLILFTLGYFAPLKSFAHGRLGSVPVSPNHRDSHFPSQKMCPSDVRRANKETMGLINVVAMLLVFSVLFIASAGGEGGGCKEQSVVQPFGL